MDQSVYLQKKSKKGSFFLGIILGGFLSMGGLFFLFSSGEHHSAPMSSQPSPLIPIHKKDLPTANGEVKNVLPSLLEKPSTAPLKRSSFQKKETRASIGLVFVSVGGDPKILLRALRILPKEVAFSFAPYTSDVSEWILTVYRKGHDVLVDLPLDSLEYPQLSKGSYTLLRDAKESENLSKLELILEKGQNAIVGVYGFMGSRILASKKDMYPILKTLKKKGYLFLETKGPDSCVKSLSHILKLQDVQGVQLEGDMSEENLKKNLQDLENKARDTGFVVGIIPLHDLTLGVMKAWIETLNERGFNLMPVSTASLYQQ